MTKVDIISGFLGAGKTTLIKKIVSEALSGEQVVLIENEFGEIGIDGGFLRDAGIEIREMNSGCICCSLVGDFGTSLKEVIDKYHPDRIIIEPSGVGKLSDVIKAVKDLHIEDEIQLNSASAVVDALKCKVYMKNFGEFFNNQIENASTIILSRTQKQDEDKLQKCIEMIKNINPKAHIITTPWEDLEGTQILGAMENATSLEFELLKEQEEHEHHHHDGEGCGCGQGHGHGKNHGKHEHNGDGCGCGKGHGQKHEHEHGEGESCGCGHDHGEEHDHDHHEGKSCGCGHDHGEEHGHDHGEAHEHHHHADEVFNSWGIETPNKYEKVELETILQALSDTNEYGQVLRAKGMVSQKDGSWLYFDLVPGEYEVREGKPDFTGRICVIGANLEEEKLNVLFKVQ